MKDTIDIDELWRTAARKLRMPPTPPRDIYVEGLRRLAASMQTAGRHDGDALRTLQRALFARILADLQVASDVARHPEIAEVPVRRPLFVAGFGRTGSTMIHNLLALDPNVRAPRLWELWSPSPPPRPEGEGADPRIEIARDRLREWARSDPLILHIHPMAADAPDECHLMMRHSPLLAMLYQVPEYWDWMKGLGADELEELHWHYRLQVQHLQLFCRREHWVSKATTHLYFMPVLFNTFPDARVIRLHRDPCEAIPSLCSLVSHYRRLFSSRADYAEIGATILDIFVDHMRRSMDAPAGNAKQIIDVRFEDLVSDPLGTVRQIYAHFGYPYGEEFEQAMVDHLARERAAPRHRHEYTLEEFGLTQAQVIERSAEYCDWARLRCTEMV